VFRTALSGHEKYILKGWSLSTGVIDIVIVSGLLMILMRIAFIIFVGDDCELINIHSATGRMGWDGIWVCFMAPFITFITIKWFKAVPPRLCLLVYKP